MATNAERQKAYRERHLKNEGGRGERLNTVIDVSAKRKLERLARYREITQRAVLESLLDEAEKETLDGLTAEQAKDYYGE